jgi:hypothetical protein
MWIKNALAVISILTGAVAYASYFRQIFGERGVEPHPFSWLPWGLINLVGYLAQRTQHGGPGAWVTLFTACVCLVIALVTLLKYGLQASPGDWLCLSAAFLVFAIYLRTKNPDVAAILASVTNAAIFVPTLVKGWRQPYADSASSFALNGIKYALSIPALASYTLATLLFPFTVVILSLSVTVVLMMRRRSALPYPRAVSERV